MQTFKQYFETLLIERSEMVSNISKFEKIIGQIEDKVKNHPNFEHGARIEIPLGKKMMPIIFYHSLPTKVKELTGVASSTEGIYIPVGGKKKYQEFSGSMCIALANVYKGQSIKNPFQYTKQYFPSDLKNLLMHELQHAWEDRVKKISKHTFKENPAELDNNKRYYNNPSELNAYISQFVYNELTTNTAVYNLVKKYDIQSAIELVMAKITKEAFVRHAHPNNRRWILKTAYTLFDQYLNKIVDHLKKQTK
jgi:hypothetical protein